MVEFVGVALDLDKEVEGQLESALLNLSVGSAAAASASS